MPAEITVKKLLKKSKFPEAFAGKFGFSPYMGCSHDCKYCDGRFEKYHFEGNIESDIKVRINTAELLAKELATQREYGAICISSGISDAYQPAEKKYQMMKECSAILAEYNFPVILHTKSNLMLRDWDNWQKVNEKGGVNLYVSITWLDDKMRKKFEPYASSAEERWELLETAQKSGFKTGALAMPLIPQISDSVEHMTKLLEKTKSLNLDFIWLWGLTLKPGRQKDYFIDFIKAEFPEHLQTITELYQNNDKYGTPMNSKNFNRIVLPLYHEYGFSNLIPHHAYKGRLALYDEISVLLYDMQKLYRQRKIPIGRLKSAAFHYREWLKEQKRSIAYRRKIKYSIIDTFIKELLGSGQFNEIIKNPKLTEFLKEIALNNKIFNYFTLKLEQ